MDRKPNSEMGPPTSLPDVTPSENTNAFTLSTVIEIHRSLGRVERAIDELTKQSSEQANQLKDLDKTIHGGKVLLKVIAFLITLSAGVIGFFLNKIWDAIIPLLQIKPHP